MSGKKATVKKSGRKDFSFRFEPLTIKKQSKTGEKRSSSSSENDKEDNRNTSQELPNVLKNNIARLSDSSESIKLTEFGKSFIAKEDEDIFGSPKNKKLFSNSFSGDSKIKDVKMNQVENKRLKSLQNVPITSSPSMMHSYLGTERSKGLKESGSSARAAFDKFADSFLHEEPSTSSKRSKLNNDEITVETKSDKTEQKNPEPAAEIEKKIENSDTNANKSIESSFRNDNIPKIGKKFLEDYKESLNNFRQFVNEIKSINEKIVAYRQELSEFQFSSATSDE